MDPRYFAFIGVAGFIAPKHLEAIKATGNVLAAALDKSDSVGILDNYFPDAAFFTEFERFDRHLEHRLRSGEPLDFMTICSPNYLHDAHIRYALRLGLNAICEKPLVLNPWNLDVLEELEEESQGSVFPLLQLRLHPAIRELRESVQADTADRTYDIDLTYITPRGRWYLYSWKGDAGKSGGIATNLGIHFFDALSWIFGPAGSCTVHLNDRERAAGLLQLKRARVRWYISISHEDLPPEMRKQNKTTHRSLRIEGKEVDFSEGFDELHIKSYEEILGGRGLRIRDVRPSIEIAHRIRNATPEGLTGDYHPLCGRRQ